MVFTWVRKSFSAVWKLCVFCTWMLRILPFAQLDFANWFQSSFCSQSWIFRFAISTSKSPSYFHVSFDQIKITSLESQSISCISPEMQTYHNPSCANNSARYTAIPVFCQLITQSLVQGEMQIGILISFNFVQAPSVVFWVNFCSHKASGVCGTLYPIVHFLAPNSPSYTYMSF